MARSLGSVNKKYRRLATTFISMVMLIIAQPFLWGFVNTQALDLQQRRSQEEQIANVKERNTDITGKLRSAREFLSQLEVVSPPLTAKTQIVERVEQLADQAGLSLDITVIQEVAGSTTKTSVDNVIPVSMSVAVTGTIQQLLTFLDRVEHTQELSLVPTWTLVPAALASTPVSNAGDYTLTMDIYFFLRKPSNG